MRGLIYKARNIALGNNSLLDHPIGGEPCPRSQTEVMPPIIDVNTAAAKDMEYVAHVIHNLYISKKKYKGLVVFGDEQVVGRFWEFKMASPSDWAWLTPFPGEFHLLIHVCHGIYRLFPDLLLKVANFMNRDKIKMDFQSAYWQKQEDFLLLVVEAGLKWYYSLRGVDASWSVETILEKARKNYPIFTFLNFLFKFGLHYWGLRQAVRANDIHTVDAYWAYWLPLFICTNKNNYSKVCLQAMIVTKFAGKAVKQVLNQRLLNIKGLVGHYIAPDMACEKVLSLVQTLSLLSQTEKLATSAYSRHFCRFLIHPTDQLGSQAWGP
jgi:hypothetical protein